jgi:hypothetical protein
MTCQGCDNSACRKHGCQGGGGAKPLNTLQHAANAVRPTNVVIVHRDAGDPVAERELWEGTKRELAEATPHSVVAVKQVAPSIVPPRESSPNFPEISRKSREILSETTRLFGPALKRLADKA